jgi:hypothetical protein
MFSSLSRSYFVVFLFLYGKKVATRQKHGHMCEIFHSKFRILKSEIEGLSSTLARQNENSTIPFNPKSRIIGLSSTCRAEEMTKAEAAP